MHTCLQQNPDQAHAQGTLLARHWLEVGLVNSSYLYVDSHVKVYNGTRLVPEVWTSHRRMPLPGIVRYFVDDLRGRPLLVVNNDGAVIGVIDEAELYRGMLREAAIQSPHHDAELEQSVAAQA